MSTRCSVATKEAVLACFFQDGIIKRSKIIDSIRRSNMDKISLGIPRNLLPKTPEKAQVSGILFRAKANVFGNYTVHPKDLRDLKATYGEEPDDPNEPFFISLKMRDEKNQTYVVMVASTRNLLEFGPSNASIALDGKHNASYTEFKLLLAATLDGNGTTIVRGTYIFRYNHFSFSYKSFFFN